MVSYRRIALAVIEKVVQDLKRAAISFEDKEVEEVQFSLSRLGHLDENPPVYRKLKERIEMQVKKLEGEIRDDFGGGSQPVGGEAGELDDGYDADEEYAGDDHQRDDKAESNETQVEQHEATIDKRHHHNPAEDNFYPAAVRLSKLRERYNADLTSIQTSLDKATLQHKQHMARYCIFPSLLEHELEPEDLTFNVLDLVHEDLESVSHNLHSIIKEKRIDTAHAIARRKEVERRAEIIARLDREDQRSGDIWDPVQ